MDIDTDSIVYITVDTIIAFLAILGNSLVCIVVLKSAKLKKKPMYLFVTSLAIADISVGAIAIPFAILTKLGLPHDSPTLCTIMLSFIIVPTQISIFNLMAVSIERYLSIRHPRLHYAKLNKRKSLLIITATWMVSFLFGLLSLAWNRKYIEMEFNESINENFMVNKSDADIIAKHTHTRNESSPVQCKFMEVMEEDFMLFNFVVCVLAPLLVCGLSYFMIYESVSQASPIPQSNNCRRPSLPDNSTFIGENNTSVPSTEYYSEKSLSNHKLESCQCGKQLCCGFNLFAKDKKDNSSEGKLPQYSKETYAYNSRRAQGSSVKDNASALQSKATGSRQESGLGKTSRKRGRSVSHLKRFQKKNKETRVAAVLGLIVLAFAICWMPLHILNTITKFNKEVKIPEWIFTTAILLSHANSAVNFFLYSWRLETFRKALNRMLKQIYSN